MGVLRSVEIGDEADPAGRRAAGSLRTIARVDSNAVASRTLAQRHQKLALAAAYLEHRGARADAVLGDLVIADVVHEAHEARRERLRLLVRLRVGIQLLVEADVGNETAVATERQFDVAPRKLQRLLPG